MVNIVIDGKQFCVDSNMTILEAAAANDIKIPTLCYLKGVNNNGSCRLCLVEVELWIWLGLCIIEVAPVVKQMNSEALAVYCQKKLLWYYLIGIDISRI